MYKITCAVAGTTYIMGLVATLDQNSESNCSLVPVHQEETADVLRRLEAKIKSKSYPTIPHYGQHMLAGFDEHFYPRAWEICQRYQPERTGPAISGTKMKLHRWSMTQNRWIECDAPTMEQEISEVDKTRWAGTARLAADGHRKIHGQ